MKGKQNQQAVMDCACKHDFQDERYGKGRRVHNVVIKKGQAAGKRCTACGKEKN